MYKGKVKEMSDDEFIKSHSINHSELYEIEEILKEKGINNLSDKLKFVEKNFYGQYFMYYALKALDDVILMNYQKVPDEFTFSKDAVDGILRSYLFAISYLTPNLPEHAHKYLIGKSSSFFDQLVKDYGDIPNLK